MPRHLILTACLLVGFLCPPAHGQLPPNVPVRINIAGARRANVGQKTELRVELLNQQGAQTAALDHTTVRLLATKHRDIRSARSDVQPGEAKHRDSFELPADRTPSTRSSPSPAGTRKSPSPSSPRRPGRFASTPRAKSTRPATP